MYTITILDCLNAVARARDAGFFDFDDFDCEEYEHYEKVIFKQIELAREEAKD